MARSARSSRLVLLVLTRFRHSLAGEDVGERLDVGAADHGLALLALAAQAVHELRAEDVDLAVQDASLVRHLLLLLGQIAVQILEVLLLERPEIRESVHFHPSADSRELRGEYNPESRRFNWSLRV